MTDVTPGKRYRYTVEGVLNDKHCLVLGDTVYGLHAPILALGELEQLPDPLPTTAGSVVRSSGGSVVMRRGGDPGDAHWVSSAGAYYEDVDLGTATIVLFDAGADR
jgi:hypothetical protein